jgi:polysaccharide pyruvyl transferase WcaK-like protein
VFLFTNGSPEDEAYLTEAAPRLLASTDPAGSVALVPRFTRPVELARFIATLDLLAAHRLHACIAAYSYGVPHIGFTWDAKLRSFFEAVGRVRFICGAVTTPAETVVALAEEAMRFGIDQRERASVVTQTIDDIGALARALVGAPGPIGPAEQA